MLRHSSFHPSQPEGSMIRTSLKHFCPQVSSKSCWTSDHHKFFLSSLHFVHNTLLPLRQNQHQLSNYISCGTGTEVPFSLLPPFVKHPHPSHALAFFLTQCSLSEIPSFFLHPGCSNAPGTGTAGGRAKSSTVYSHGFGRYRTPEGKMGMQSSRLTTRHSAARLPLPTTLPLH